MDRCRPGARIEVPSSVIAELRVLVAREAPGATAARALANRFPIVPAPGRGDDAVLRVAARHHAWVVTADRAFRDRLVESQITVLVPRDRHRLELVPGRPVTPRPEARRRARPPSPRRPRGNG